MQLTGMESYRYVMIDGKQLFYRDALEALNDMLVNHHAATIVEIEVETNKQTYGPHSLDIEAAIDYLEDLLP